MPLSAETYPVHCLNYLDRVLTHSRFGGQHDRIGTIEDRVCHIEHFRPGWNGVFDHRLHHLCGRGNDPVMFHCSTDNLLLQARQFFVPDFYAEIATRHHHHIRGVANLCEIFYRLHAFDLGNQGCLATGFSQQIPRPDDVLGTTDE